MQNCISVWAAEERDNFTLDNVIAYAQPDSSRISS